MARHSAFLLLGGLLLCDALAVPQHATLVSERQAQSTEYDFIIAGGGVAGLTVADRLTEQRYAVVVHRRISGRAAGIDAAEIDLAGEQLPGPAFEGVSDLCERELHAGAKVLRFAGFGFVDSYKSILSVIEDFVQLQIIPRPSEVQVTA